jgi:hypothetical protein
VSGLSKAKEAGKNKVTKKHLTGKTQTSDPAAPKATRINDARAKQLFQALQSVLHDPGFGKLSPGTIEGIHRALIGMEDLLDLPERAKASRTGSTYCVSGSPIRAALMRRRMSSLTISE